MNQTVTLDQLQQILKAHTEALVRKFSGVLQHNNEQMHEYVQESIEAISALQIRQNDIQTALDRSLEGLSDTVIREVTRIIHDGGHIA